MIRPVLVLSANATALDLLRGFKEEAARAGVVLGDHGRVLGLATFNDLVSILVGEAKAIA
jgi:CBS domain containing-hemolysin-like protein